MGADYPFYQPEGPYTFERWEDKPNTGEQLWLSAVWKNSKGEEYRVQARCVDDLARGAISPQTKIHDPLNPQQSWSVDTFPADEIQSCVDAYEEYMRGRNRPDLGALGSSNPPFAKLEVA